jgi:hypothetical protein
MDEQSHAEWVMDVKKRPILFFSKTIIQLGLPSLQEGRYNDKQKFEPHTIALQK